MFSEDLKKNEKTLIGPENTFSDEFFYDFIPFIEKRASLYKLNGFGREDLLQEGFIGLFDAMKSFSDDKGCSFNTYARRCIVNRMTSFIRKSLSGKNAPLSNFINIDDEADALESLTYPDPEKLLMDKEMVSELKEKVMSNLTDKERKILRMYLSNCTYREIAAAADISTKSVDNALFRIKKKLKGI